MEKRDYIVGFLGKWVFLGISYSWSGFFGRRGNGEGFWGCFEIWSEDVKVKILERWVICDILEIIGSSVVGFLC